MSRPKARRRKRRSQPLSEQNLAHSEARSRAYVRSCRELRVLLLWIVSGRCSASTLNRYYETLLGSGEPATLVVHSLTSMLVKKKSHEKINLLQQISRCAQAPKGLWTCHPLIIQRGLVARRDRHTFLDLYQRGVLKRLN